MLRCRPLVVEHSNMMLILIHCPSFIARSAKMRNI